MKHEVVLYKPKAPVHCESNIKLLLELVVLCVQFEVVVDGVTQMMKE